MHSLVKLAACDAMRLHAVIPKLTPVDSLETRKLALSNIGIVGWTQNEFGTRTHAEMKTDEVTTLRPVFFFSLLIS